MKRKISDIDSDYTCIEIKKEDKIKDIFFWIMIFQKAITPVKTM